MEKINVTPGSVRVSKMGCRWINALKVWAMNHHLVFQKHVLPPMYSHRERSFFSKSWVGDFVPVHTIAVGPSKTPADLSLEPLVSGPLRDSLGWAGAPFCWFVLNI